MNYLKLQITQLFERCDVKLSTDFIFEKYSEKHRHFHTLKHIQNMCEHAKNNDELSDSLFLAIVFHDLYYDPTSNNNEEKSASCIGIYYNGSDKDDIIKAILNTKTHSDNDHELSNLLNIYDLAILYSPLDDLIEYEHQIFKEYQFVDYPIYKKNRIEFLNKYKDQYYIQNLISYLEVFEPKIGIYAGSFNPFSTGHKNILEKAEKIFDKVIIARGVNTDKRTELVRLPDSLKYHQVDYYNGLLTDFLDSKEYDVTLIRGLRNGSDFESEKTLLRWNQDLKNDIKVVYIISDSEFEHVSSSGIRTLQNFNIDKHIVK